MLILALGEHKAKVVRRAVEESETAEVAASFLQSHPQAEFVLDPAAAAALTAVRTPWAHGCVNWTLPTELRAVIWLSQQSQKPILKLEARDFLEHHLTELVQENGPVQAIRQRAYEHLAGTICHQPGGEKPCTALVFSPHPDDDVISMGGTLITLVEQGHDVHVAYMTSGNIAVFDHDALRHVEFVSEFLELSGLQTAETCQRLADIHQQIEFKARGALDSADALAVKGLIRKTEAVTAGARRASARENCHFLDLPFYQTGQDRKRPIGPADVEIVAALLRKLDPAQVYFAGDLSDPHGTHRMCAEAILAALQRCRCRRLAAGGLDVPRCLAGVRASRDRPGGAAQSGVDAHEEAGDLPARVAEGRGAVPRPRRTRVLGTGGGSHEAHSPAAE